MTSQAFDRASFDGGSDLYPQSGPYGQRPKIEWPGGNQLALWVVPNIEFYELDPPVNPSRRQWPRPHPDVVNYSHRDFGNRVGIWRLFDVMDGLGIRGTVSLNTAVVDHHPEVLEACLEREWDFFSHGIYNTRLVYGMDEDQEREVIEETMAVVHASTGRPLQGWLGPALTCTERTLELLAEYDLKYTCDLFHDDQPVPVYVRSGKLISLPYALETNDIIAYKGYCATPRRYGQILRAQFDQLYLEGESSGTVMCIPLHPYLVGQMHRIAPFAQALEYILGHDHVWPATGREIAGWYYEHYYDSAIEGAS